MATIEEKILKLRDKRAKLEGKIDVVDAKLEALQRLCKHPTTKHINGDYLGGYDIACVICNKKLPGGSTGLG